MRWQPSEQTARGSNGTYPHRHHHHCPSGVRQANNAAWVAAPADIDDHWAPHSAQRVDDVLYRHHIGFDIAEGRPAENRQIGDGG